jgi:DNA primase
MSVFELIQDRLSIVEVVEEYTPVFDRGSYFVALCPFHKERRPSMSVSKEKGVYYCFGCMATGNMFSFVQNIENISKKEALEKLALRAGITLDDNTNNELDEGYKLLIAASQIYNQALKIYLKTPNYLTDYIAARKLSTNIIEQFTIGYAPKDNIILNFMKKNNIPLELGLITGLLIDRNGTIKDKFSDRLMIPIHNEYAKVVGFTGRTFPHDTSDRPKYLNSPESKFFNKSKLLYGLDIAKKNILSKKQLILVEGNMDVIASHQYDLNYTIATQGTATTVDHIRKIKKLNSDLILAFDNDNAGKTAELKVFKMAIESEIPTFKLIIPNEYKDIDEYIKIHDSKDLNIVPYLQYFISNIPNLTSTDIYSQRSAINHALEIVKNADPIIKAQAVSLLHNITQLDLSTIKNSIAQKVQLSSQATPVITLNPIKVGFYQILALDQHNPLLPKIYEIIKEVLDYNCPTFAEYIIQNEIEWIITSEKTKYVGVEFQASTAITNLIQLIKRASPNNPLLRELGSILYTN